jgi:undecaprenyl-diphosphatase
VDELVLRAVNEAAAEPWLAALGVFLSSRWMLVLVGGPLALRLARRRAWGAILSIVLAVGVADLVSSRIVKPAVGRVRPCRALDGIRVPDGCGPAPSFPSSHAATGFALAVAAAPGLRYGWGLLGVAAAVAASRVLLGVHYPSDVVAGAALGALIGGLAAWVTAPSRRRSSSRAATSGPARPDP